MLLLLTTDITGPSSGVSSSTFVVGGSMYDSRIRRAVLSRFWMASCQSPSIRACIRSIFFPSEAVTSLMVAISLIIWDTPIPFLGVPLRLILGSPFLNVPALLI
jgi:hypothetical protein